MLHCLLDVSWLLYKGYYSSSHIWDEYPEIHFLIKKIASLLSRKDVTVHLCLDGYDIRGKKLLGENYKAGRHQEGSYNVYAGLASFIKLLNNNRIKVYYGTKYESDEVIYSLSKTLEGRKKILSGDKDLLQSLSEDVIIDNGGKFVITSESYKHEYADKFYGIDPIKLPLYRAICGDSSDTLKPPVPRFPHKLAAKLITEFEYNGTIPSKEQLLELSANYSDTEKKWINRLIDSYENFKINFDIMKLNIITDSLSDEYKYKEVEFSNFLKSKIEKLNSL